MRVEQPIFIVGVGRSGSTIFHKIFSEHPQVAWLSGLCDRFPDKPSVNRLVMKAIDYPVIGQCFRYILHPDENYVFWENYCKGFRHPCRDLLPGDVTNKMKEEIRFAFSEMLSNKRSRLLVKITGWPRIGFIHEIFNDAKFVHVLRDGRAVVNSMINVDWWWGWRGPSNWRWGELTLSQNEDWKKYKKSFVALAGIEWMILMDAMKNARRFIDMNDLLEVRYEDLCSNPLGVFQDVIAFCNLKWSREFEAAVKKYDLRNTNYKWRNELTNDQQNIVEDILEDTLTRYGY